MTPMRDFLHILADTAAPTTGAPTPGGPADPAGPAPSAGNPFFLLALMAAMIVFMVMSSRSRTKREQRQREEMFAGMQKNDRVLTIGGVIGTVVSIKGNEVVLKVDEATNTKMTFLKTAVQRVITEEPAGGKEG
jgi:preprotein translocase subunit YajC